MQLNIKKIPFYKEIKDLSENLKVKTYFVGGTPRDLLLERSIKDIDIVVLGINYEDFANKLSDIIRAYKISFKDNIRLIKGHIIIDVSKPKGCNIEEDLYKRDITINSMALDINSELLGDTSDLFNKVIRMNYDRAFFDDPLRTLRVFRFASELGFSIEEITYNKIKESAYLINKVAIERVFEELYKTFTGPHIDKIISQLIESGLLSNIFNMPEYILYKNDIINVFGNSSISKKRHSDDIFVLSIALINIIMSFFDQQLMPKIKRNLKKIIIPNDMYKKIIYFIDSCIKLILEYKGYEGNLEMFVFNNYYYIDDLIFLLEAFGKNIDYLAKIKKYCVVNNKKLINDLLLAKNKLNMQKATEVTGKDLLEAGISPGPLLGKYLLEIRFRLATNEFNKKEDAINYIFHLKKQR